MIRRKHAIDVWAGSSLEASWSTLLQTQKASSSTDIRTNSTCTFDASSLEYTTFSFFPGNGMPVKEVRQKWSWHSLREGNCSRPNKMLQWACMATRDTEDQLLSWFTSARSHCQETQDAPWFTLLLRVAWRVGDDPGILVLCQTPIHEISPRAELTVSWHKWAFNGSVSGRWDRYSLSPNPCVWLEGTVFSKGHVQGFWGEEQKMFFWPVGLSSSEGSVAWQEDDFTGAREPQGQQDSCKGTTPERTVVLNTKL